MQFDKYEYSANTDSMMFTFCSEGPRGSVMKAVKYVKYETGSLETYNLSFGDLKGQDSDIDDLVVTNNGDAAKILATVAETVVNFTTHHPHVFVFAEGSTPARTRFYRMYISKYHNEISNLFFIFGLLNGRWQRFRPNKPYKSFLVTRK